MLSFLNKHIFGETYNNDEEMMTIFEIQESTGIFLKKKRCCF